MPYRGCKETTRWTAYKATRYIMTSAVCDLYWNRVLQKLHNSVTNQVDTTCIFSPAFLILEYSRPHCLHWISWRSYIDQARLITTDRQTERREWQAHELSVLLFGSKTVKHKRAHRSGMFTQFEVGESARKALAPLPWRMLLEKRLMACRIGLIFWTEVHFTLFVDNLLNDTWDEEADNTFRSTILSSVFTRKLTWSLINIVQNF